MLTKADDYPIHQTAEPVAYSGTDRNFYDRYFFNGYQRNGDVFFAGALGVYPHLNVMDASFCVIHQGKQYNVHASRDPAHGAAGHPGRPHRGGSDRAAERPAPDLQRSGQRHRRRPHLQRPISRHRRAPLHPTARRHDHDGLHPPHPERRLRRLGRGRRPAHHLQHRRHLGHPRSFLGHPPGGRARPADQPQCRAAPVLLAMVPAELRGLRDLLSPERGCGR